MIRFYLGEAPLLRSPETLDLAAPSSGEEAIERLEQLVVKPRDGFGGHGVTVMPRAEPSARRRAERAVRQRAGPLRRPGADPALAPTRRSARDGCAAGTWTCGRTWSAAGRRAERDAAAA